jgi:hypothetical protein
VTKARNCSSSRDCSDMLIQNLAKANVSLGVSQTGL